MIGFYKSFCPFFSKCLHTDFNPSQMLLLSSLVMVTNEGSLAGKSFKKGNLRGYSF